MIESVSTVIRSPQQRGDDAAGRSFRSALDIERLAVVPPPPRQPAPDQGWQALAASVSRNPTAAPTASDLARPLAAAQLLSRNRDKWGLHTSHIDFSNPPASLPQEAKDTLRYLSANPILLDAISAGDGTPSSTITKASVDAYIKAATADLSAPRRATTLAAGSTGRRRPSAPTSPRCSTGRPRPTWSRAA